ncbi:hypothetical protein MOV76_15370 [Rhizobium sp. PRIMUS64]|uniref:hypothetical protein n=1 Tax=Rhizobium sp. PRIMUS64 TaxID=2908925 RepID=UPI001FF3DF72|nr:hypothetical protein [Rhizobium sp. PRIMUS64]MCJ9692986.1 hypothetical protein [Rhizobium sp. PRIMUS64]
MRLNRQYRRYATETLRPIKQILSLALLALPISITGCGTPEPFDPVYVAQIPPTPAERSEVIEYARKTYYNERDISDASISNVLTLSGGERIVCVKYKAKNQLAERAGVRAESFHYDKRYGFALGGFVRHDYRCNAKRLRYLSFAELEHLF